MVMPLYGAQTIPMLIRYGGMYYSHYLLIIERVKINKRIKGCLCLPKILGGLCKNWFMGGRYFYLVFEWLPILGHRVGVIALFPYGVGHIKRLFTGLVKEICKQENNNHGH